MEVQAITKVLNEPVRKTDRAGHDYMQQILVLEAQDGENVARWAVSLPDSLQQCVKEQQIKEGDVVVVNLTFDTFTAASSGYVGNKVGITSIARDN